jgi:hypothetical protein
MAGTTYGGFCLTGSGITFDRPCSMAAPEMPKVNSRLTISLFIS